MVPSAATAAEGGEAGGDVSLSEVAFCLGEGDESAASPFSLCSLREKVGVSLKFVVLVVLIRMELAVDRPIVEGRRSMGCLRKVECSCHENKIEIG